LESAFEFFIFARFLERKGEERRRGEKERREERREIKNKGGKHYPLRKASGLVLSLLLFARLFAFV